MTQINLNLLWVSLNFEVEIWIGFFEGPISCLLFWFSLIFNVPKVVIGFILYVTLSFLVVGILFQLCLCSGQYFILTMVVKTLMACGGNDRFCDYVMKAMHQ